MESASPQLTQIKSAMKASWMAGDFGQIAKYSSKTGEDFITRTAIKPGTRVLDVACGTGIRLFRQHGRELW
jgi:2-polyprenyl-3-methyl-5-hydroxy-6-metoxy-1,4-benzoquinol methylase